MVKIKPKIRKLTVAERCMRITKEKVCCRDESNLVPYGPRDENGYQAYKCVRCGRIPLRKAELTEEQQREAKQREEEMFSRFREEYAGYWSEELELELTEEEQREEDESDSHPRNRTSGYWW